MVVLAVEREEGGTVVTVVPITNSARRTAAEAVEIPVATRCRMGLNEGRS